MSKPCLNVVVLMRAIVIFWVAQLFDLIHYGNERKIDRYEVGIINEIYFEIPH